MPDAAGMIYLSVLSHQEGKRAVLQAGDGTIDCDYTLTTAERWAGRYRAYAPDGRCVGTGTWHGEPDGTARFDTFSRLPPPC